MRISATLILIIVAFFGIISCSKDDDSSGGGGGVGGGGNNTGITLSTNAVTSISINSAVSGGNITSDGGSAIIARGVCYSTTPNPTIINSFTSDGTGTGTFTSNLSGLLADTLYYVRAYATNGDSTGYGNEISFITPTILPGQVVDIDGFIYDTVLIGTQVWMKQNLKVSKYRNGDPIPTNLSKTT